MHTPSIAPTRASTRLRVKDVACQRGARPWSDHLSFDIEPGQIVWLRGQNGRGKTSLLRLVAGLSQPTLGHCAFDDGPAGVPDLSAQRVVFIAHTTALKDELTASESLQFLLRLHGRRCAWAQVHAALDRLGLRAQRDALVRSLSPSQRRRVALARLAVEERALLWLLDEPFDALDADGVQRVVALLDEHRRRGGSVLLTSHVASPLTALRPIDVDLDRHAV